MAKKKSKKITSKSKTKGKGVKSTKKSKGKVSRGTSKKKPLKSKKTPKKPITWVNKTKQKLQLSRKQDKNRYQNLISVISDYYNRVADFDASWVLMAFYIILLLILIQLSI